MKRKTECARWHVSHMLPGIQFSVNNTSNDLISAPEFANVLTFLWCCLLLPCGSSSPWDPHWAPRNYVIFELLCIITRTISLAVASRERRYHCRGSRTSRHTGQPGVRFLFGFLNPSTERTSKAVKASLTTPLFFARYRTFRLLAMVVWDQKDEWIDKLNQFSNNIVAGKSLNANHTNR